jgi:hypothetical protein
LTALDLTLQENSQKVLEQLIREANPSVNPNIILELAMGKEDGSIPLHESMQLQKQSGQLFIQDSTGTVHKLTSSHGVSLWLAHSNLNPALLQRLANEKRL